MAGADPFHGFDRHRVPPTLQFLEVFDREDVVGSFEHIGDVGAVHGADRIGPGRRVADAAGEFSLDEFIDLRVGDGFCRRLQERKVLTFSAEAQRVHAAETGEDRDAAPGEHFRRSDREGYRQFHDEVHPAFDGGRGSRPFIHDGNAAPLHEIAAHRRNDVGGSVLPTPVDQRLVTVVEGVVFCYDACGFHKKVPPV